MLNEVLQMLDSVWNTITIYNKNLIYFIAQFNGFKKKAKSLNTRFKNNTDEGHQCHSKSFNIFTPTTLQIYVDVL